MALKPWVYVGLWDQHRVGGWRWMAGGQAVVVLVLEKSDLS
jgi:hypothetical protein